MLTQSEHLAGEMQRGSAGKVEKCCAGPGWWSLGGRRSTDLGNWTLPGKVSPAEPVPVGLAGLRSQGQGSAHGAGAGRSRGG